MDGNQAFVASVGRVAFDQVARPAFPIESLKLSYNPTKDDGERLEAVINGRDYVNRIYDWQLVPIVRFADSDYYSCFSLFGKLLDREKEQEILRSKGRILNYHPAFEDTLLGLRLFQLDVLLVEQWATALPKNDGKFLLGAGERPPDLRADSEGANSVLRHLRTIQGELGMRYRSYVICDYNRPVTLKTDGKSVMLTGEPYYYCWRYRADEPGFDKTALETRVRDELPEDRESLIVRIVELSHQYEGRYTFYSAGTLVDLIRLPGDQRRAQFLRRYATESLRRLASDLPVLLETNRPVHLEQFSERLSSRSDLLRSMNPAVWEAGVVTMRYAAFFRYCRINFPKEWRAFLQTVSKVPVEPRVTTPTVMR